MMTAQQHHALYCRCGGMNEQDMQCVTEMRRIVEREARPCVECGNPWSFYGGCVNPDCTNYESGVGA
jgi:hypothetical protein